MGSMLPVLPEILASLGMKPLSRRATSIELGNAVSAQLRLAFREKDHVLDVDVLPQRVRILERGHVILRREDAEGSQNATHVV